MKIISIEVFECAVNRKDSTMAKFNPVLIRVNTDEGISGVGEVGLAYGKGHFAGAQMVRDLSPIFLGKDPMKIESLWETVFRGTFWGMGGGPVIYGALSALDIACWDIRGKALNAPVWQLLGGLSKHKLRTYASQIQFDWGEYYHALKTPEEYAEAARHALADGYDCVKVDPLMLDRNGNRQHVLRGLEPGTEEDVDAEHQFTSHTWNEFGLLDTEQVEMAVDRVAAVRDTIGSNIDIIIEIHSFLGENSAIQLGRALEPFNIFYYEEPIYPLNVEGMVRVARNVKIPLASGERIYTRWGYRPFFEKQALAVIQPDICLCGGITETKKICDMANVYDTTVQIHVCGGPVSTAAALQIEAAIPNFIIHEHHTYALKHAIRELCTYDYQPVNGKFTVPDLPGLGLELNDDIVSEYKSFTLKV